MTKRTRSEFEHVVLLPGSEEVVSVTTPETEPIVAKEVSEDQPNTVDTPSHKGENQHSDEVEPAQVALMEGSADEVATASWAVDGELENHPFWALLGRAGYTLW